MPDTRLTRLVALGGDAGYVNPQHVGRIYVRSSGGSPSNQSLWYVCLLVQGAEVVVDSFRWVSNIERESARTEADLAAVALAERINLALAAAAAIGLAEGASTAEVSMALGTFVGEGSGA